MDHLAQRNGSDYYHQSQPELMHNMNVLHNRSSVNIISNVGGTGYTATSSSTSNVTSRERPNTEEWKKSSSDRKSSVMKMESWKMSGRPRHAQLQHVQDDIRTRRQSAPLFNSPYQQHQQQQQHYPKPLPQEPSPVIQQHEPFNLVYPPRITDEQPPFHLTTPAQQHIPSYTQQHIPSYTHNEVYPAPLNQAYPPTNDFVPPPLVDYQQYHHPHPPPSQPYNEYPPSQQYNEYPASQPYNEYPVSQPYNEYPVSQPFNEYPHQPFNNEYPPMAPDHLNHTIVPIASPPSQNTVQETPAPVPVPKSDKSPKKKKDAKPEKKIRQITVQSINIEHRVWIDVLPAETGLSLAEKIHIIATFRTRKIISITTASGRKIPLDNRPVFGSWMEMEKFEDGERWEVEWRENDRGVVDRFMSKIVQSKRKD